MTAVTIEQAQEYITNLSPELQDAIANYVNTGTGKGFDAVASLAKNPPMDIEMGVAMFRVASGKATFENGIVTRI